MLKRTIPLASIIILLWAATLALNYLWRRANASPDNPWPAPSFFYTFTIFAIGLLSFVGFLSISRDLRGQRDTFQDGDVRFALTCSFVTVFLALLSFFSFAPDEPTDFAKGFFDSFLNITVTIVGFYFFTSGAIEFVRIRQSGKAKEENEKEDGAGENRE